MSTDLLRKEETSYLDSWLTRVSRSFAVVIAVLEEPLRTQMASAYLLCRVIDNIEDCTAPVTWKKKRFIETAQLLVEPELAPEILPLWETEPWPGLTQDERKLMSYKYGSSLWQIFSRFTDEVRSIIRYWTLQMVEGMSHLQDPSYKPKFVQYNRIQVLAAEQDYNHYCYIVAGTVGNLATELVILHYRLSDSVAKNLFVNCGSCGRGLQKTNILKDFPEDLTRGICYLPDEWLSEVGYAPLYLEGAIKDWKRKVIDNVLAELRDATEYTLALPYEAAGYRMSSLLCLLPALQTILFAAQNQGMLFTARHPSKISRQTFQECIMDARKLVTNNGEILNYFQQLEYTVKLQFARVLT